MSILRVLKFISNHPLTRKNRAAALGRFLKWQLYSRLVPYPVIYPFVGNAKLIVWKGLTGATGNMYAGLHEFHDMAFLLHLLQEEDLFADIGANIGSYTILASGYRRARTVCFEPIPKTFGYLENNISINKIGNIVRAFNIGLGATEGKLKFTADLDTVNHVVMQENGSTPTIEIDINSLDNILQGDTPLLLKIDVEGFETEVLAGASKTLAQPQLKAVIIELNGSGSRYGYDEEKIHQSFLQKGFEPYSYDPFKRDLIKLDDRKSDNVIYIRDLPFVRERVRNSPRVTILGQQI